MECPKCSSEMEEGMARPNGAYVGTAKWGKGINWVGNMKNGLDVITYRCKKCGYLESYAK